ncbi:ATP-dependent DNA ligase [Pararobbsia alpina]|uniref:DNA ligase n=1 Tax=Pararobbsia alpina TaxID=621374 RepID=A0A6S7BPY8_9BURK|nr:ATP-dependent DNA ligase [Pararobbsia alpina]CAB3795619.1 DNA ligase [Pararobbsia alpina]
MIPRGFKPNLAATLTKPELIKFPVWASPKIDGIRYVVFDGVAYSRSLKPIPNHFIQQWAKDHADELEACDGELVVGRSTDPNCMQNSMAVMRKDGEPDFTFYVFDLFNLSHYYETRQEELSWWAEQGADSPRIRVLPHHLVTNTADMATLEAQFLEAGYEGMMIRSPSALYKCGRSTEREGGLVKVKRFRDAEALVVGFVEEMHNTNEAKKDAFGRTERSTEKSGLVGKGTLGALIVRYADDPDGTEFNIGTGFTAAQRAEFWQRQSEIIDCLVTFKYFDHGIKDAPRHPVFKSFRATEDIS